MTAKHGRPIGRPGVEEHRVVVLTTSRAEEDIYRTYDLSAASYITKPVTFGVWPT